MYIYIYIYKYGRGRYVHACMGVFFAWVTKKARRSNIAFNMRSYVLFSAMRYALGRSHDVFKEKPGPPPDIDIFYVYRLADQAW